MYIGTIHDGQESRQYIVKPTGLELKVIMNKDIEKNNFTIPQIKVVGSMREISLNLDRSIHRFDVDCVQYNYC